MTIRELEYLVTEKVGGWRWYVWNPAIWPYQIPEHIVEDRAAGRRFLRPPHEAGEWSYVPATGAEPIAADLYTFMPPRFARDETAIALLKAILISKEINIDIRGRSRFWRSNLVSQKLDRLGSSRSARTEALSLCLASLELAGIQIKEEDITE